MGDSFQYGDLLFLGLIAVFVALRLRAMLGRNQGLDPRNIWKQATRDISAEKVIAFPDRLSKKTVPEEELVPVDLQENKAVSDGLRAIKAADANFSTSDFLSGARLAFEWAVKAFSEGNKDKLRTLLSDSCFQHFSTDIDTRLASGLTQETTLISVLATDITEAAMLGKNAHITVQFTTEQVHVSRDKDKNIVAGDMSAIEKVIDIWTFERSIDARDPNWKIIAT